MKTLKVSSKGQVAIPKSIRDRLQIKGGDRFAIEVVDDSIVLKPVVKKTEWFLSPEIQEQIRKAEDNFKQGRFKRYDDVELLIQDLKNRE